MNKPYDVAVFIGRFQPFHLGHLETIQHGLKIAEKVVVLVGSSGGAPTPKNPFTFEQRSEMIYAGLRDGTANGVHVLPIRDYFNSDQNWVSDIRAKVARFTFPNSKVALVGGYKDGSSYYLEYFRDWKFNPAPMTTALNATDLRKVIFGGEGLEVEALQPLMPLASYEYLEREVFESLYCYTLERLQAEYRSVESYKASWASAPFPPTFITADAVVTCNGHVLLIRRKDDPGKGLLALPGGFLDQGERILACALRELKEEAGLAWMENYIFQHPEKLSSHVFDHPGRSMRGRTVTHAYHFKLDLEHFPATRAGDDAAEVLWLPFMDLGARESEFFSDHLHIINHFIFKE